MQKLRTIFFGTHDFAKTILAGILANPLFDVQLVITQPDKPFGRDQTLVAPPVKILAQTHNIPVEQPASLKQYFLPENTFDIGIVAQYGLLIPEHILNNPTHGLLNVHGSLLPKYRGASPVQAALIHGETMTGITIMKMDKGLDTGPILLQKEIAIEPNDRVNTLFTKLETIAVPTLIEAVTLYTTGKLVPQAQDNTLATICREFTRDHGRIDWTQSAEQIYNQFRGLTPWPGIWTTYGLKRLKLLEIKPSTNSIPPGTISVLEQKLFIGCGNGSLELLEVQLEGKKPMTSAVFMNGYRNLDGTKVE